MTKRDTCHPPEAVFSLEAVETKARGFSFNPCDCTCRFWVVGQFAYITVHLLSVNLLAGRDDFQSAALDRRGRDYGANPIPMLRNRFVVRHNCCTPCNFVGPPVRGADCYGREAFVSLLWEKLSFGHVLLALPRRFGKTSVMYRLMDEPRWDYRLVHGDLEHFLEPADLLTALVVQLSRDDAYRRSRPRSATCRRRHGRGLSRQRGRDRTP